jgi:hypothetical protein
LWPVWDIASMDSGGDFASGAWIESGVRRVAAGVFFKNRFRSGTLKHPPIGLSRSTPASNSADFSSSIALSHRTEFALYGAPPCRSDRHDAARIGPHRNLGHSGYRRLPETIGHRALPRRLLPYAGSPNVWCWVVANLRGSNDVHQVRWHAVPSLTAQFYSRPPRPAPAHTIERKQNPELRDESVHASSPSPYPSLNSAPRQLPKLNLSDSRRNVAVRDCKVIGMELHLTVKNNLAKGI